MPELNLKNLYSYYASHPEALWIIKLDNAVSLNKFLREHKVKKILDLGTGIGCSAALMAYILKDKKEENFEIHTVEQNEKCYKLAQELMPTQLKEYIKYYFIEPSVWRTNKIPYQYFSIFKELPKEPEGGWDLIFVDGPGIFMKKDKLIDLPNGDVFKLLLKNKIKPGTFIAWDKRIKAFQTVERYFGDDFYYLLVNDNPIFNVIEKKEGKAKFRDDSLDGMKEAKYF